jgi:4-hydroxybenzoate polyprenyltransferase
MSTTTTTTLVTLIHKEVPITKLHKQENQLEIHLSPQDAFKSTLSFCKIIWDFIQDDVFGFVIPSSIFGILSALSFSANLSSPDPSSSILHVLQRAPLVLLFNLANIVIWDLSNQRAPESVDEDRVNKPWRPIPSGRITPCQTRKVLLVSLPLVLVLNYALGVHADGLLLLTLGFYYNDLKGSDEVCRDAIIALCYTLANKISFQIAIGPESAINHRGYVWIATIGLVALSTMHTQDLKDQIGDKLRGRITVPLFLGDEPARAIVALLLPFWSCICGFYWGVGHYWISFPFSLFLARRVWTRRTPKDDSKSWKFWCLWHMTLFFMPLLGGATI